MTTTIEANQALADLGFSLESDIPAGAVQEDWPCISYQVTLKFKDKPILVVPYRLGVGHVDIKKARLAESWTQDELAMLQTWQSKPQAQFKNKQRQANIAARLARTQEIKPQLADVLHSLLLDGEAFFLAQSFEQWAAEFGYDEDSRKAEAVYRAYDAIGRKLASALPEEVINQIRTITADL